MAKGGKHLNTTPRSRRAAGAHLSEKDRRRQTERESDSAARRIRMKTAAPEMIIMLLLCLLMITPLRSCILSDEDYIGYAAARQTALSDAGLTQDKARDVSAEMIKIDDNVCYKVQFSGSVTDYRYIIDAETGDILGQTFYRSDS